MKYKILIIAILFTGLVIVAASIVVGIRTRDVQVEDNPYEAGLTYEDRMKKYAELGWKTELPRHIRSGEKWLSVGVFDGTGRPLTDASVECLITMHAGAGIGKNACRHSGGGFYQCGVDPGNSGYMNVKVTVRKGDDTMNFENIITVDK